MQNEFIMNRGVQYPAACGDTLFRTPCPQGGIEDTAQRFIVRQAQPGDTAAILSLIKGLAEYEHMSEDVSATEAMIQTEIFEKQSARVLIGEENGLPVGFMLYFYNFSTFLGKKGLYLEDLYILPSCRGKGYGKKMLRQLAQIAVAQGCGRMEWSCLDWNEPSIQFYKALGAQPLDTWTTYRLTGEALTGFANSAK